MNAEEHLDALTEQWLTGKTAGASSEMVDLGLVMFLHGVTCGVVSMLQGVDPMELAEVCSNRMRAVAAKSIGLTKH